MTFTVTYNNDDVFLLIESFHKAIMISMFLNGVLRYSNGMPVPPNVEHDSKLSLNDHKMLMKLSKWIQRGAEIFMFAPYYNPGNVSFSDNIDEIASLTEGAHGILYVRRKRAISKHEFIT